MITPKSFYIKTFGCQMNVRDSEIIAQSLVENGFTDSHDIDSASLIILNTCAIRAKAAQKVYSLLGSLRKNKNADKRVKICVAGCVAQQEAERIISRMKHVDLVVGTQHIYNIPELLENSDKDPIVTSLDDSYRIPRYIPEISEFDSPASGQTISEFSRFVTIMQGCNNFCTYCVVPYTRGRESSRMVTDIVEEVTLLVNSGVSEITLLGQNVNSYGKTNPVQDDGSSISFASLLKRISLIKGLKRLRFTTSNPKDLSEELIDCFSELPNLCPQFHLPVQSGSDAILKKMNRKYTVKVYLEKVNRLRTRCPDIALSTDIIIGFPGETEDDFLQTMELLETVRFHGSFSFKYSDRPGTSAERLLPKIDEQVKKRRLKLFQDRQDEISLERNRAYVGKTFEILVEKTTADGFVGRTETNHIVHIPSEKNIPLPVPGTYVSATITYAGQHSLKGKR